MDGGRAGTEGFFFIFFPTEMDWLFKSLFLQMDITRELVIRVGLGLRELHLVYHNNDTFREIYQELAASHMSNLQFLVCNDWARFHVWGIELNFTSTFFIGRKSKYQGTV